MLALDDYLEKMRTLKEAIAFFSTHPTYKNKLEHVVSFLDNYIYYKSENNSSD